MIPLNREALPLVVGEEPQWRTDERLQALQLFIEGSMPSAQEEAWRYVDLDFDLKELSIPQRGADPLPDGDIADCLGQAHRLTVVDGRASGSSSEQLVSLRGALADREAAVRSAEVANIGADTDLFSAAHNTFGSDGAFLHVEKGQVAEAPFYIDIHGTAAGSVSFPAVRVEMEEASFASLVVHLRSVAGATMIPQLVCHVGPGAGLKVVLVQDVDYGATTIGHARVVADRDASIDLFEVGLGGNLARLALTTDLVGDGSTAQVRGAYFGEDHQTLDYRYVMNHIGRNTRSDMFLKGAVEDEAMSVFTGLIRIEETGQKTEAFQTNRNLLLSEGATAQSVPNLEILANDVKCGHGSTVGPLNEDQRYYLMSRGLEQSRADRLQVRGFFEEVLARLPVPDITEPIRASINRKYVSAQEEGRV